MRRIAVAAVGSVILMAGTAATFAVQTSTPGGEETVYTACANTSSGTMRLLFDDGSQPPCRTNEVLVQWNAQGPEGPAGLAGDFTTAYGPSDWVLDWAPGLYPSIKYLSSDVAMLGDDYFRVRVSLVGARQIGAVRYRPTQITYCVVELDQMIVDKVELVQLNGSGLPDGIFGRVTEDDTDRTAEGCYEFGPLTTDYDGVWSFALLFKPTGPNQTGFARLSTATAVWTPEG